MQCTDHNFRPNPPETTLNLITIDQKTKTGAGLGHYWFNRDLSSSSSNGGVLTGSADDKGLACHL